MNVSPKNKNIYLVEATGGIAVKTQKYTATDPDEATHLAFRHEAYYRMQIKYPNCLPQQVIALIEECRVEMPDFKVRKISLIPSEVNS